MKTFSEVNIIVTYQMWTKVKIFTNHREAGIIVGGITHGRAHKLCKNIPSSFGLQTVHYLVGIKIIIIVVNQPINLCPPEFLNGRHHSPLPVFTINKTSSPEQRCHHETGSTCYAGQSLSQLVLLEDSSGYLLFIPFNNYTAFLGSN